MDWEANTCHPQHTHGSVDATRSSDFMFHNRKGCIACCIENRSKCIKTARNRPIQATFIVPWICIVYSAYSARVYSRAIHDTAYTLYSPIRPPSAVSSTVPSTPHPVYALDERTTPIRCTKKCVFLLPSYLPRPRLSCLYLHPSCIHVSNLNAGGTAFHSAYGRGVAIARSLRLPTRSC